MAVKVKDIAEALGLSPATVSLAINNRPGVNPETRERVLEAVRTLGYEKVSARSPAYAMHTLHFVIFKQRATAGLDTSFFSEMMEGVERQADLAGANLMITYINAEENIPQKLAALTTVGSRGVILLATELTPAHIEGFLSVKIPMVVLDAYFEGLPLDCVTINNAQGAYLATTYLASRGHTRIGYLTSKVRTVNFSERHEGFRKAFRKLGMTRLPFTFQLTPSIEGACEDMKAYLRKGPEMPTAFFADNDILAAGAMRALKEMNLRVPEDVSIVGFDDIPLCKLLDPPLTTVSVPKKRLGSLAVERLYQKIEKNAPEFIKIEVGTTLVERSTVRKL